MSVEAKKNDQQKPDLSLLPASFLNEVAKAMMHGAKKYGRDNYKNGHEASRLIAAAMRHLTQWMDGEDIDNDSGNSHLGHAAASILMLVEQQHIGTLRDNRYKRPIKPEPETTVTVIPYPDIGDTVSEKWGITK